MKNKLFFFCASLMLAACSVDDAEYLRLKELVAPERSYTLPASGGTCTIPVYCNGPVSVRMLGADPSWATLDKTSFDEDGELTVTMTENPGLIRGARLVMSRSGSSVRDTVDVLQNGVQPVLRCDEAYQFVNGSVPSHLSFKLETNIPFSEFKISTTYSAGRSAWVSGVGEDDDRSLGMDVKANPTDKLCKAIVTLSYRDGWFRDQRLDLVITQANAQDESGTVRSFSELQAMATSSGYTVRGDDILEGVVVGDRTSRNMAHNPTLDCHTVDLTPSETTTYIQSVDGSAGFRLEFASAADNVLEFGTLVSLNLHGAVLCKESDPDRYVVKGLTSSSLLKSRSGTVVEKPRKIADLTDADLYTYVKIQDVELPIKEGSFTDIRENYVLESSVNTQTVPASSTMRYFCLDSWATVVADLHGRSIAVPINVLCEWRKPAEGVPQGNGTLSGVLVSERLQRYGNVGRYQLRPADASAFDFQDPSPWKTLAKWDGAPYQYTFSKYAAISSRYKDNKLASIIPSDDASTTNPVPAAELFIEKTGTGTLAGGHSYKSVTAVTSKTCGISSTYKSLQITSDVRGWFRWENGKIVGYNGLRAEFSTAALSGSEMQVTVGMYAGTGNLNANYIKHFPTHWCAEYSVDGGETYTLLPDTMTGEPYFQMRSLPYFNDTGTCVALGATVHCWFLPATVFGKDKVCLRIRPYDDILATQPISYLDEIDAEHVHEALEYDDCITLENLFIRYR